MCRSADERDIRPIFMEGSEQIKKPINPVKALLDLKLSILDLYAAPLVVLLILMLPSSRFWIIELIANFLHWILIPSILIFIFYLIKRRWRRAIFWSIPVLIFIILFGGLFLPKFNLKQDQRSGIPLKVMDWNIEGNLNVDLQPQVDLIRDSGADIITLQEVSNGIVPLIESQLRGIYPYQELYPAGISGTGVLSKYPIQNAEVFQLSPGALYNGIADVDIEGTQVTLIDAHPSPPFRLRQLRYVSATHAQIMSLIPRIPKDKPVLMMGDFNMTDQSIFYRNLTATGLKDTWREAGWGFGTTWPVKLFSLKHFFPLVRIDYIWHSDEFKPISIRVGEGAVSDHKPVIAEFVLNPG
jgi:vancomycin resistance protein VanJ